MLHLIFEIENYHNFLVAKSFEYMKDSINQYEIYFQNVSYIELLAATVEGSGVIPNVKFNPSIDKNSQDPVFPVDYLTAMKTGL